MPGIGGLMPGIIGLYLSISMADLRSNAELAKSLRVALWVCYWIHRNAVDGLSIARFTPVDVRNVCAGHGSTSHAGGRN